ncbi:MAG: GAF domain-containing sensor histidine kinase [Nannocystaceae bacterium]
MSLAPLPTDEAGRLNAVRRYEILDTERERGFDDLVALAAQITGAPIALLSLVDEDRQWFKARVGFEFDETPRALAFCAYTILSDEILEIGDAREDPRVADHPLVCRGPELRFYAGAPLITSDGFRIGALCVLDRGPRRLSSEQRAGLEALARQAIALLELRHGDRTLARLLHGAHAARVSPEDAPRGDEGAAEQALLACVARDLRAPLTAILGVSEALSDQSGDAVAARPPHSAASLRVISAAAEHMLHLVGDVVDLVRVESGRLLLHPREFSPAAVAHEIVAAMRPLARAGGNAIEVVDHDVGSIVADPTRLRQVLFHLVSNACDATREGAIAVELVREGDDGVSITVRDTGVGIAEHVRRRLFRPSLPIDGGGVASGLGLVLTRGLCERMGGAIAVESAPGEGATFTVWLPARPPRLADDAPALLVVAPEPGGRARLLRSLARVARVVVVDTLTSARTRLGERRFAGLVVDAAAGRPSLGELERLHRVAEEAPAITWLVDDAADDAALGALPCVVLEPGDDLALRQFVDALAAP